MGEVHGSSHRRRGPAGLVACTLATLFAAVSAGAQPYVLVDLGADLSPEDLNSWRDVVGFRQLAPGVQTAFLYLSEDGSTRDLGGTIARAVNDAGIVVGDTATGAFVYDGSTTLHFPDASAWGLNEDGLVSGYVEMENPYRSSPRPRAPALYDLVAGGTTWEFLDVASVYPRGTRQGVYADRYVLTDVDASGTAVGVRSRSGLNGSSAILTPPAFDQVVYLPIPGGGRAAAINDFGLVVGTTGEDPSTQTHAHAFLYDGTSVTDLGTLNGGLRSSASDVNNGGQVVGSSWLSPFDTSLVQPDQYHAFLWDGSVLHDLNDLVDADGWILTAATAINDGGDIVGTALVEGDERVHGYLLVANGEAVPPEPSGAPPVAVVTADVTKGKPPLTVQFDATDSYDPEGSSLSYTWDFGDGTGAAGPAPSHIYLEPASYVATLTVRDDQGLQGVAQIEIAVRGRRGRNR